MALTVRHGTDPSTGHWGCPIRQRWGLTPYQACSPVLEEKLAFTITATGTFAQAAAVAGHWGCPIEASTLHALTQRLGARAEAQIQQRLAQLPVEVTPQRAASALAVLLLDGWQVRQRGPGWGRKQTKQSRVEWHELKTGVFYRHEQAAHTAGGRGLLAEKVIVSWQGEPLELGRRLHAEALRGGLGRAVVGRDGPAVAAWVEPRLHRLRHGKERAVVAEVAALHPPRGPRGAVVRREQSYLAGQVARMPYARVAARGWPIGSGAVESACRLRQCRCKRPGQFWTARGLRHLCALEEARANGHWDQLWLTA